MYYMSVDLGQAADYTAISVLETLPPPAGRPEAPAGYLLRHLERPPLGTTYPAIVARVVQLLDRAPLSREETPLVVDKTGVGRPVTDMFRAEGLHPHTITITGGHTVTTNSPSDMYVPKKELASTLVAVYQSRRLQMPAGLELGPVLIKELLNFRPKINIATGNVSFEAWRERDHDDLVLSVAMALWLAESQAMRAGVWFVDRWAGDEAESERRMGERDW
jgi:hypothetical protein